MIDYPKHLEKMWERVYLPRDKDSPKVISTFAGGGGSLSGYLMAGYDDVLAVEIDNHAVSTLKLNYPELKIYHGDIAKLSVSEVMTITGIKKFELDILDGSPPCQGFSTAGKRNLDDPRNQLFKEFVRLLDGLKPKVFVMENVSGLVKGKMKLVFAEMLKELKACGYNVKVKLLNAKYFHVPQSRERLIFIGVREDLGIEPSHPRAESGGVGFKFGGGVRISEYNKSVSIAHKRRHKNKGNGFGYQLLRSFEPSPTLPKTFMISGSSPRYIINDTHYHPSITELMKIGSFCEKFKTVGEYKDVWARIGNSVPPLMMEAIARHIRINILDKVNNGTPK